MPVAVLECQRAPVVLPKERRLKEQEVLEFPATLAQRRYWLLHQVKPGADRALNMTLPVRLRGPLDRAALQAALNEVVARHESLRTAFTVHRGELQQHISQTLVLDLPFSEAATHAEEHRGKFVETVAREEAQLPFDVQTGPFMRARLLRFNEFDHLLLLTIHRLISDEYSNDVLVHELCACYAAFVQDREPVLPKLQLQFADYAYWQREHLAANDFAAQREYWQGQLSGNLPALYLPSRRPRSTSNRAAAACCARVLPAKQVDAARALAARHGAAPLVVFLALFDALVYRHTGQRDFLVAVPSPNREHKGFDALIGPLANALLLRAELRNEASFLDLIHRVGRTTLDAFANQDVPFELLLDDFQSSQLQVSFVYRLLAAEPITLPGNLKAEPLARVSGGTLFELSAAVVVRKEQTRFELEYDPALFDREIIVQILSDYEALLRELIADPQRAMPTPRIFAPASEAFECARPATAQSVSPYLGLQLQLVAIWQDLLGVPRVGIRDNFFDLGGNSLLALRMLQRVENICGKPILPSAFASNPTVETLAGEIAREAIDESLQLLAVHESGSRTPFFYFHGDLFGGGFYAFKLSRALGTDQPVYVLPPIDVRDLPEPPSIEQMAASHLQAIRAVRPHGPYVIGGFCLGGIIAYELAQQLIASGETVEMLLLIDAEPEDKTLRTLRWMCETLGRRIRWNERVQIDRFREWALLRTKFLLWRRLGLRKKLHSAMRQILKRTVPGFLRGRAKNSSAQDEQARDVPTTFLWAAAAYRPRPYRAPMAVLLSQDLMERGDCLARAWQRLADKAVVHPLPGNHLECITAHVDTLAERIDQCLRNLAAPGSLDRPRNEN